jgi:uncharacterized protein YcbK (DUF882 family)
MRFRRRDILIGTGLTIIFGRAAHSRILSDAEPFVFADRSAPRRLFLKNDHTGEVFSGPYRDRIGPIPEAMVDLAMFLRDHRENASGPIYVETLDFLADVVEHAGLSRATVLSAYRTKKTNEMLASRIFGVAEKSKHLEGRAKIVGGDGVGHGGFAGGLLGVELGLAGGLDLGHLGRFAGLQAVVVDGVKT